MLTRFSKTLGWALVAALALTLVPVLTLRWMPPPTSAFMFHRSVTNMVNHRGTPIRYRWVDWPDIAPHMRLAVVAAEDQKFPHHWGFDLESIADAVEPQRPRRHLRGASTISQQVAKNLFLWSGRSYVRKGLEAYYTILLELFWSKQRILEVYLNIAEFGDGIYGVHAASGAFFGKLPAHLRQSEAALLAAVLPNPTRLHANAPSPYVLERAGWIEAQMDHLGGPSYLRAL